MYLTALVIGAFLGVAAGQQSCTADYCQNGGICVIVLGDASCACAAGFMGKNCETAEVVQSTACMNQPCLNGGTCTPNGNLFTCACPSGYAGTVCQVSSVTAAPTNAPAVQCPRRKSDKNNIACNPAEVVFMIEYARGDSYFDVDHEGDFIKRLIDLWRVDDQHIRVGVVTYHDDVSEVIHIDDYANNPNGLKDRITSLSRRLRPSGTNDLAKALEYVRSTSFTNARPGVEKIVIPIVHMMPQSTRQGIVDAATKLKADCVTVIGFGVEGSRGWGGRPGQNVNAADVVSEAIMDQVVTSPARTHYAEYDDYTALEAAARDYDDRNCS